MTTARDMIDALNLTPYPEGGWHSDTWQPEWTGVQRPGVSAIYYLLEEGQSCHWHRIDCDETWYFHAGHPLRCSVAAGDADGPVDNWLCLDVTAGKRPSHYIPRQMWQSASAERGWALVSCVVSPAFTFDGWTLAGPGWTPGPISPDQSRAARISFRISEAAAGMLVPGPKIAFTPAFSRNS